MSEAPASADEQLPEGLDRRQLASLDLFVLLPADARSEFVAAFEPVTFGFGDVIVREGNPADALFVIGRGRARVLTTGDDGSEVVLGTLKAGDVFGEAALLRSTERTATVRASGEVVAWRLAREVLDDLLRARPEARRWLELQTTERELAAFFKRFTGFRSLPAPLLERLLRELVERPAKAGETIVVQGDPPGPMWIVRSGRLRVYREENGERRPLAYLRRGDWFGELSVFAGQPRAATVVAHDACVLLELKPETFKRLIAESPEFASEIQARVAQYDFRRVARVPLDFDDELLPAEAATFASQPENRPPTDRDVPLEPEEFAAAPKRPSGRRRRRVPFVAQIDEMDCGAACLGMICRYFGRNVSLTRIRELAHTSVDGTSLRALVTAGEQLNLAARSVRTSMEQVPEMPLPAIVHWAGNHWVVLEHLDDRAAWIVDPGVGRRKVSRADFATKWSGFAALFDYTPAFEREPEAQRDWAWLVTHLRPHTGLLLRALGLAGLVAALQLALPVFSQVIVDRVLVESDASLLTVVVIGMFTVLAMSLGASMVQRYLLSWVAVRFDAASLDFLTRALLALPMKYFAARRTGDILRRLGGMAQIRDFLVQHAVAGLSAFVQLAVAVLLMFVYSPLLAVVALSMTPGYVFLLWYSRTRLRPMFDSLEEASGHYQSYQIDAVKGIETVKAMGAEGALRELMLNEFLAVSQKRFRANFTMLAYDGVTQVMGYVTTALVLWVGAARVMAGELTIGGFVAFTALVTLATGPIQQLLSMWDSMQWLGVLLNRLQDVLEPEPEQGRDRSALRAVRTLEGHITLQDVGFRYGGSESPPILEGLTIDIRAGTRVAIVGRSGSGKTTLVKLLAGLLEPTGGRILLDGQDLEALDLRMVRRQIGFVLQQNHVFNDTIARNIAFGEPEPDLDAVIWAARAAAAHEFIERLPFGYDTKIGESGLALSGGQLQRIAIARALYRRPPILLFDEATSALDTESERAVKENLDRLLEGRTSLVIAHRLSTVRDANVILVLERGHLVEQGTHDELMARQGLYFYLVSQQISE
ncbi:MAG: cyclic nucleotide-binding domain-containing protein [Gemmatimonadales bacterium]